MLSQSVRDYSQFASYALDIRDFSLDRSRVVRRPEPKTLSAHDLNRIPRIDRGGIRDFGRQKFRNAGGISCARDFIKQFIKCSPLRDRFEHELALELYSVEDLIRVVKRSATLLGLAIEDCVAEAIAVRSRGTPRIANRLLRRVRDYSGDRATIDAADQAFGALGVDAVGMDLRDRRYLSLLNGRYVGRPFGLSTIAAALDEDERTVEDIIEPWLLRSGVIERTAAGRISVQC